MPDAGVPESFKVLIKELQSLAIDVEVLDENDQPIEIKESGDDEDIDERASYGPRDLAGDWPEGDWGREVGDIRPMSAASREKSADSENEGDTDFEEDELLLNGMHSEEAIPELDGFDLDLNDLQLEDTAEEGELPLDFEDL